jgi:hypothetical protein
MLRDPQAADRWTWIIIACLAQLYLARTLAADIQLPWQRPQAGSGSNNGGGNFLILIAASQEAGASPIFR